MKALVATIALFLAMLSPQVYAVVDLNTGTQSELETVKGLGPAKAKAIIEYRTKNGPFATVDDLDKVKGFGKASIDKIRTEVTVGKPSKSSK